MTNTGLSVGADSLGLHDYRPEPREFLPRNAQTYGGAADENNARKLTSSRDEAAEERIDALFS